MAEEGGFKFTDFPDHLIHEIMLLLDGKSIASLTASSKKLMQLWVKCPTMKFSNHGIRPSNSVQFENFVLKSLSLRRPVAHPLRKLCLSWNLSLSNQSELLNILMEKSSQYGVKELVVDLESRGWANDYISIWPSCLLNFQNLRKLDVVVNYKLLTFPFKETVAVLDSLETLNLSNVQLNSNNFQIFVSKSCPNLKFMSIQNLFSSSPVIESWSLVKLFIHSRYGLSFGRIDVLAPQLKTLVIEGSNDGMLRLHLSTPNLKTLRLDLYNMRMFCVMENMPFLKEASILVREQYSKSVLQQIVSIIQLAEHLTVSKAFIRAVAQEYEFYWLKLIKVTSLVITTKHAYYGFYGYLLPTYMASFLNKVPYLKHLRIEGCPKDFNPFSMRKWSAMMDAESWEFRKLGFIRGLRTLQLEFCGTKDEVEFVNYVLRNASELEKCVVNSHSFDQCGGEMREMLQGIDLSSPAASLLCIT